MPGPSKFQIGKNTYTVDSYEDNILGHGAYGIVYLGMDSKGNKIAAKRIIEENLQKMHETKEISKRILGLDHDNLVKIFDVTTQGKKLWIFMEYCGKGALNRYFQKENPTFDKKMKIITEIATGVEFLHEQKIVHRDIKPTNVLISESGAGKLADYDYSKLYDPDVEKTGMSSEVGALQYRAPEFFKLGDGEIHEPHVDTFASGLTFLAMLQYEKGSKCLTPHFESEKLKRQNIVSFGLLMHQMEEVLEELFLKKKVVNKKVLVLVVVGCVFLGAVVGLGIVTLGPATGFVAGAAAKLATVPAVGSTVGVKCLVGAATGAADAIPGLGVGYFLGYKYGKMQFHDVPFVPSEVTDKTSSPAARAAMRELIQDMIMMEPEKRPSPKSVVERLKKIQKPK